MTEPKDIYIQHKGLKIPDSVLPNSLESLLINYRGRVETDTILLADGEVAILHGSDFHATADELEGMTVSQIEQLEIVPEKGFSHDEHGLSVPLLREYIGLASDADTFVALELKASSIEKGQQLARTIMSQLSSMKREGGFLGNEHFLEEKMSFQSFSVTVLHTLQEEAKKSSLNLRTCLYWPSSIEWAHKVPVFDWKALERVNNWQEKDWHEVAIAVTVQEGLQQIEFQPGEITAKLIENAHSSGIDIGSAPTDNPKVAQRLVSMGVDWVGV